MKSLASLFALLITCACALGAAGGITAPPGGGTPGQVVTLAPGGALTATLNNVRNGTLVELGAGAFTVNPSILNSNLFNGNTFTGAKLLNKTNVTIQGVPGLTVVYGTNAPGELLWISNCSNIKITGVTFYGYTNHNFPAMSPYPGTGPHAYLWAGVNLFRSERVQFEDCSFLNHFDHGLQDKGAENSTGVATSPPSTNGIVVRDCYFSNIGSWRTNASGGATAHLVDGASIVCTGWTIDNCYFENVFRGVEPFDDNDATGQVFANLSIRDCNFRNVIDFAISPAGSTNAHNAIISNNRLDNDVAFSFRGTNYGPGQIPWPCVGFLFNGGRGWQVLGNSARGGMYIGFQFANNLSFLDDFVVADNSVYDINRGDSIGFGFWVGDNGSDSAALASSVRRLAMNGNKAFNIYGNGYFIASGRDIVFENNVGSRAQLYTAVAPNNAAVRFGTAGYTVNRLTNIVARNNSFFDGGAGAPYAFTFHSSVASLVNENNLAVGYAANDGFTNLAGSAVSTLGSLRSFSAALDFPSIAASGSATLTFAATGATTNDAVSLQYPAATFFSGASAGVAVTGWASNDVVYVRVLNNDTGVATVDFPSARFTAEVRQSRIRGE